MFYQTCENGGHKQIKVNDKIAVKERQTNQLTDHVKKMGVQDAGTEDFFNFGSTPDKISDTIACSEGSKKKRTKVVVGTGSPLTD